MSDGEERASSKRLFGSVVKCCDEPDPCRVGWDKVFSEVHKIDAIQGARKRNRAISASYARLYQGAPELKWAGAAAFASKQVGCAMGGLLSRPVKDVLGVTEGLGKGNLAVYDELYPALRFYQQNKATMSSEQIMECMNHKPGEPLHESIKQGLRETMNGDPNAGALTMLKHEQQDTLQSSVYDSVLFRFMSNVNKVFYYQIQPMSFVMSADCESSEPGRVVNFANYDGHIYNFADRWPFARDCAEKFITMSNSPQTSGYVRAELARIADAYPEQ